MYDPENFTPDAWRVDTVSHDLTYGVATLLCASECGAEWSTVDDYLTDDTACNKAWRWSGTWRMRSITQVAPIVWEGIASEYDRPEPFTIGYVGTIVNGVEHRVEVSK